jgi:peptidoglycan-N-acetylmuramic acid deacetylase
MLKALFISMISFITLTTSPIHWGLSHNNKNLPPIAPPEGVKLLQQYNGIYQKDTDEKQIFFTFDLGYEAGFTGQVLDILKENNIKAIFFLCGNYLSQNELINRMINEGHYIGNHTDRHKNLPSLSQGGITKDIMTFQNDFLEKYPSAKPPVFFRPPQGQFDEKTVKIASENNLRTVMWTVAIQDWSKSPIDAQRSADKIAKRVHNGAIVLMHITNLGTVEMLKILVPRLLQSGYTFGNPDIL